MTQLNKTKDTENSSLKIYPNPSEEYIVILRTKENTEHFLISALNGKVVKRGVLNSRNTRVEIEKLPRGIYILTTSDNESKKIIKN